MRILFAYFDFSVNDDPLFSPHLHEECDLNLSTKYNFRVEKSLPTQEGECIEYKILQEKKPEEECLPDDFWGDRIYNITAIVGDNGSGKSTILHNLIKSVIMGLKPNVPFLIIFQQTKSNKLLLYCSKESNYTWASQGNFFPQYEYPGELMKTKTMLLDNTLSLSSYDLSLYYNYIIELFSPSEGPYYEWQKQFYNKSLYSSVQFSNDISKPGMRVTDNPVSSMMSIHFSYESFQETRFLFDRYHLELLEELERHGFPVPRSKHLMVDVQNPIELYKEQFDRDEQLYGYLHPLFKTFYEQNISCQIVIDSIITLMCRLGNLSKIQDRAFPYEAFKKIFSQRSLTNIQEIISATKDLIDIIFLHYYPNDEYLNNLREFLQYIEKEEKNLSKLFSNSSPQKATYVIDVDKIASNPVTQQSMITFLDKYRTICEPRYFLTFFSGMSSGEKNLLRMLTQFRYLLNGPAPYTKDNGIYLQNKFNDDDISCDTLFLFLDEVDLTYHVEWQRILVSMLTTVLPFMFRKKYNPKSNDDSGCCDIQIILATHSPLMLGDFPKSSVIYLKNQKTGNSERINSTFGENLYTILKDGFFMEDTIGEFAKRKINSIVKWCSDIRENYDLNNKDYADKDKSDLIVDFNDYYKILQLLPSGIIRSKLTLEMRECAKKLRIPYPEEKKDDPVLLKKRIDELEAELKRKDEQLKKERQTDE